MSETKLVGSDWALRSLLTAALVLGQGCEEDTGVGNVPTLPLPTLPPDPVPAWLETNARAL